MHESSWVVVLSRNMLNRSFTIDNMLSNWSSVAMMLNSLVARPVLSTAISVRVVSKIGEVLWVVRARVWVVESRQNAMVLDLDGGHIVGIIVLVVKLRVSDVGSVVNSLVRGVHGLMVHCLMRSVHSLVVDGLVMHGELVKLMQV